MLVLFIVIQVIKTSHTHDYATRNSTAKTSLATVAHPCPICDYTFAKDNDHAYQSFSIAPPSFILMDHPQHIFLLITSIGTTAAGRGPPSLS
jgi:hypothetical protein